MPKKYLSQAEKLLPKSLSKREKEFFKTFYSKVPKEDVESVNVELLAQTARNHYELSVKRKKDKPNIKIYTPKSMLEGWSKNRTIIDIVNDDMAFLVDSIVAEIIRHGQQIKVFLHPIVHVERDNKNNITEISANTKKGKTKGQSNIHVELTRILSAEQCEELVLGLEKVLSDVRFANRDWPAMKGKLKDAQKALDSAPKRHDAELITEFKEFLEYLHNNNFTLLGYREYKFKYSDKELKSTIVKGSSLGLLSDEVSPVYINEARKSLTESQQDLRFKLGPMHVSKVNKNSTVHRRVPLDAVTVKKYDKSGKAIGELLFIGLYTSMTYSRSVASIPYLRRKVNNVVEMAQYGDASHNQKALRHILEKYPRDELLQIPEKLLFDHAISILSLQERPRVSLYMRKDPFGRYISCLVYVPKNRYETKLRLKFQHIIEEELGGKCTIFKVQQDDSPLARVLFQIDINNLDTPPKTNTRHLQEKLRVAAEEWATQLRRALEHSTDDIDKAADLIGRYGSAFPTSYHERYDAESAVYDIYKIATIIDGDEINLELYQCKKNNEEQIRLKLYHAKTPLELSDVLPIMENMGLDVITELPSEVSPAKFKHKVWVHDFLIRPANKDEEVNFKKTKKPFEDVFKKTWDKDMESDSLNQLSLYAAMDWRDITILRAYTHYLRQTTFPISLPSMETALTTHPDIAKKLVTFFKTMHDPSNNKLSDKQKQKHIDDIFASLEAVDSLDHDRTLRSLTNIMSATLRTNFYQTDEHDEPKIYLSFKIDSKTVVELPEPKPYREIFVYSGRVEGIHLRGDKIARGGIRWSDRPEDFRTEVLGLMKAQQVKNAVIVPMGAKGGFILKAPPTEGGRDAFMAEGISCYKTFIRGLLDITDNRQGSKIVPPENVVRYDEDDPYLVVAADKGTASFSDIANGLSAEYDFWLDDAFASGGSAGYDHKKMGITARGGWESVKRHFRELNHDTQTQDFDVVGVGDMGGDVFGNGMLLSEHIKLIASFNHLRIFCDPDPDPAKSFKERKRLFEKVQGWDGYNEKLLSKGGRIFLRSEKSLKLTPEIKKRFDIDKDHVSPSELITAILKARTDLMWFGGIGTYIKATAETHTEVGDKGNDALRIDAKQVRAKVLGEGANLAITQQARIEYAKNGGRLNADYIDNAGGVASSDDEVNIKILLGEVVRKPKHKMDIQKRNKLLESMTNDVAQHVLRSNYQQAQGISLMELNSSNTLASQGKFISYLEKKVGLNRELEELPDKEEIDERGRLGKGLTRPELSILQSYAKISYTEDLLQSDITNTKAMQERLVRYFPKKLREKYRAEILDHRLKNEIIATSLANGIVNRMGPVFIKDRMDKCGVSCEEVAKAYIIVREAFHLKDLWNEIESLDGKVPAAVQLQALHETARMIERTVTWFLTRFGKKLEINRDIARFEDGIQAVKGSMDQIVPKDLLNMIKQLTNSGINNGLPSELSHDISLMPILGSACDIIRISTDPNFDIITTARVYFELGEHFQLDWMRQKARFLPSESQWSSQALEGLVNQLYTCQAGITVRILKDMNGEIKNITKNPDESILQKWIDSRGSQAKLLEPLFAEFRRSGSIDIATLIIAEQRLRNLYGG